MCPKTLRIDNRALILLDVNTFNHSSSITQMDKESEVDI